MISLREIADLSRDTTQVDPYDLPDALSVGEIIAKLEEAEAKIDAIQKQKSWFYKLAEMQDMDVQSIRQVLHYRRENTKHGAAKATKPSETFLKYLAALEEAKSSHD